MAVIGTLGIETSKEPPNEGDLLAYYAETRTFTGTSPTNLETLKAALEDEVEVITYTNPRKFIDAIGEDFAAWTQTLPDEEGRNRMVEVLARTEMLLTGMDAKSGRPKNCGKGTIRIQGTYANGRKFVQDICVACAEEAVSGDPYLVSLGAEEVSKLEAESKG